MKQIQDSRFKIQDSNSLFRNVNIIYVYKDKGPIVGFYCGFNSVLNGYTLSLKLEKVYLKASQCIKIRYYNVYFSRVVGILYENIVCITAMRFCNQSVHTGQFNYRYKPVTFLPYIAFPRKPK